MILINQITHHLQKMIFLIWWFSTLHRLYVLMELQERIIFQEVETKRMFICIFKVVVGVGSRLMKRQFRIVTPDLKLDMEAQSSILHKSIGLEEFFLKMKEITSKIGKKYFFLIVMVLDIKEQENNQ